MYQDIPFRMLSLSEVEDYLREVKQSYGRYCERIERAYLVGADPFALSAKRLLERIELINKYLPNTKVITMYARTDNIASKSDEDLKALKEAGVDDLYIGVECGLNDVLETLNKFSDHCFFCYLCHCMILHINILFFSACYTAAPLRALKSSVITPVFPNRREVFQQAHAFRKSSILAISLS
jgi:hypothetical protein